MLRVRCINDDWGDLPEGHYIHKVRIVGDELPVKGREYVVKARAFRNGKFGYELEDLDYRPYGAIGTFDVDRFEIVEDSKVPNHVCEATGDLAEKELYYLDLSDVPSRKSTNYIEIEFIAQRFAFGDGEINGPDN